MLLALPPARPLAKSPAYHPSMCQPKQLHLGLILQHLTRSLLPIPGAQMMSSGQDKPKKDQLKKDQPNKKKKLRHRYIPGPNKPQKKKAATVGGAGKGSGAATG